MREDLYRGKNIDNNEWVYGRFDESTDCIIDENNSEFIVDFGTIGVFIGMTDKNSNKIFEGDIVNIEGYTEHFLISLDDNYSCYILGEKEKIYLKCNNIQNDKIVVVGDIYDNPELMEER